MQYHTLPTPVNAGYKSQGYFALTVPQNLIIFIHGFMGDAVDTWSNFQEFILNSDKHANAEKFRDADIIFYGYKSLRMQANNQALVLLNLLKDMKAPLKNGIVPKGLEERNYSRILLVAHSLGSIVTRRALLFANQEKEDWVDKTRMVLFAPAHNGARAAALAMEAAGPFLGVAAYLARYKFPVLDELKIDSPTIQNLKADTVGLLNANNGNFTKAHTVVWAELEKVVDNQPFCNDPVAKLLPKDHISVCKPDFKGFTSPVDFVINALQ